MTLYSINGYKMTKNDETWAMERSSKLLINQQVLSKLSDIDSEEDRESFEGEISKALNCDWFDLVSFSYN